MIQPPPTMPPRGFITSVDPDLPPLPGSLHHNRNLSHWIGFTSERRVRIHTGKVELGQGILTALRLIASEGLDVPVTSIDMATASTGSGPDEGITSGSLSIEHSGMAIRHACAAVRQLMLARAVQRTRSPISHLQIQDGQVHDAQGVLVGDYWSLLSPKDLQIEAPADVPYPQQAGLSRLGRSDSPRLDLPDKVFGAPRFVHDLRFPGMWHGRIVRPPSPTAQLASTPSASAIHTERNHKLVVDGRFVGVLAEDETTAIDAAQALATHCQWIETSALPTQSALAEFLETAPATTTVVHETGQDADADADVQHAADYLKPYLTHASIGPSCAVARFDPKGPWEIWTHSQGIFNLRDDIHVALTQGGMTLAKSDILIHHVEGAGCYGHNGADDAAFDAVLLAAQVPGTHVRVQWSRADELSMGPMAPAQLVRLGARTDPAGNISAWTHELWANGYSTRPGRAAVPALLAASHREHGQPIPLAINAPLKVGGGADRNAVPLYGIPSVKVTHHSLSVMPIRTSAIRALGAYCNVFAIESFIDEIAVTVGADPIELRRRHLRDPRALAVMDLALDRCRWWSEPIPPDCEGTGKGFAIARYKNSGAWCAVAVRIEAGHQVVVKNMDIAVDVGQVIDLDGVKNQIEGGAIQSVSWTLKEQVQFDTTRITSNAWQRYPILGFNEIPEVQVHVIDRPDCPPLGAGEAAQGPVAAAIGNALFNAIGVRVRTLPMNTDNIVAAMQ